MKMISPRRLLIMLVLMAFCLTLAHAQRRRRGGGRAADSSAPAARLTAMKILPYNEATDTFEEDISTSQRALFNDLNISLLVKIEVTGKAGEFANRNVQVTVSQGNRQILSRTAMLGIYNEAGKYYVPIWIYGPICQNTKIVAHIPGQTYALNKTVGANCGE